MNTTGVNEPVARTDRRGGFSLVEVMIAIVILAIGILGLAGTTAFVVRQVTLADVNTERAAAVQAAVERIRGTLYTSLGTGNNVTGLYTVSWSIQDSTSITKTMRIISTGPGLRKDTVVSVPALGASVADTFTMIVLKP
jgi:prepilin-type N-terminal cleavage/methylation domain-containing protein